jgi:hypothetical protein
MTWVAAAIAGSAVLGYMSSSNQADAAQSAADTSANATNNATALQKQMYDQTRTDQTPWREAGTNALAQMTRGTQPGGSMIRPFGMADFNADPGYSFRMSEGLKALDRSASARGGLLSGSALKGITRYGQDLASQEYQNAYNRYGTDQGTQFNRLASMAGLGQTANAAIGTAGSNMANNVGNLEMNNAANAGNAGMAAANARSSAYSGASNMLGYGLNSLNKSSAPSWATGGYSPGYAGYDPNTSYFFGGGEA